MSAQRTAAGISRSTLSAQPAPLESRRKEPLLMLCHRIPYPPNKGDKIRAWHLLRYLSERFEVYLGTFVDDPEDWLHAEHLKSVCADVCFAPLSPSMAKLRSVSGLLLGQALTLPYYRSADLQRWVKEVSARHSIRRRVVFSSAMGQFLPASQEGACTLVDFVDVDSDKWAQYADSRRGLKAWIYRREAQKLASYESSLARRVDKSMFVSAPEAKFFRDRTGLSEEQCSYFSNGVDAVFFDPAVLEGEACASEPELVFTGAMDYWPNIDAVVWFAKEVFPLLRQQHPTLRFTVVGGKPSPEVLVLGKEPGVEVTGRVPDVRPYLARALAAVAPMRVARGVQNKVLEAMAMAQPVLVSAMGLEGIDAKDGESLLLANTPDDYLQKIGALIDGRYEGLGSRARQLVLDDYSWDSSLAVLDDILDIGGSSQCTVNRRATEVDTVGGSPESGE